MHQTCSFVVIFFVIVGNVELTDISMQGHYYFYFLKECTAEHSKALLSLLAFEFNQIKHRVGDMTFNFLLQAITSKLFSLFPIFFRMLILRRNYFVNKPNSLSNWTQNLVAVTYSLSKRLAISLPFVMLHIAVQLAKFSK